MFEEALNTYQLIVKNKQYPQSGRLRVNMGNIYYEQKKFPQAIKMYRMALDQIPSTGKELRFRIFRNIGNAFVQLGQFQDAVDSYDSIMVGSADIQTAFNLLLCLYVRGDKEKMKRHFLKMLSIPIMGMTDDDEEKVDEGGDASNERRDLLKEELYLRHEQVRTSKCTAIPFDMPHAAWLMLYASSPPPLPFSFATSHFQVHVAAAYTTPSNVIFYSHYFSMIDSTAVHLIAVSSILLSI